MLRIPCECLLTGPINKDCPHHGSSPKKPDRPPKHKTMFVSELDRADWVRFALSAYEGGCKGVGEIVTEADEFLEAIQARELR